MARLGEIAEIASGGTPKIQTDAFWNGDVPWYSSGELNDDRTCAPQRCITVAGLESSSAKIFPEGSLLIGMYDTAALKMSILDRPGAFNQAIAGVRPTQKLDLLFVLHQINWKRDSILALRRGVRQKNLSLSNIRQIEVIIPPLPEQRRIADILDRAEALRAKRRSALAQLDDLIRAIFLEMFGDLMGNSKKWPIESLQGLVVKGPQNGLYKPSSLYGAGTPILRIDAFYDGLVTDLGALKRVAISAQELESFHLNEGDIVINRVNSIEYLGKCALIPSLFEPTVFESNMMRLAVDQNRLVPLFASHVLQSRSIKLQILKCAKQAVNQASINQQDVLGFEVPVPPLLLQQEFARRVQAIDQLKAKQRASLAHLDELFLSLQHRAFRGEL